MRALVALSRPLMCIQSAGAAGLDHYHVESYGRLRQHPCRAMDSLSRRQQPKWNTYMSYHKVNSITGDTITLDRPTEFDFTGATGATNFGVISINPVTNVTVKDLRITMGASSAGAYVFDRGFRRTSFFSMTRSNRSRALILSPMPTRMIPTISAER